MYRPLPEELTIKESDIHGLGLFAVVDIEAGHDFGITHHNLGWPIGMTIRTPLGGFYNHSTEPNCETKAVGYTRRLQSINDIKAGEELTAFYTMYSMEDE
jgi:SET domain-containing protein